MSNVDSFWGEMGSRPILQAGKEQQFPLVLLAVKLKLLQEKLLENRTKQAQKTCYQTKQIIST